MKAVRIHEFGQEVEIEDLPKPAPEKGKAVVRIRAASVNPVDWMIREQIYNPPGADQVPMTLGQDFAGVVERVEPSDERFVHAGDEVFGEVWGSFAEYALVPVSDLVRKPEELDFVKAASLPMAALTAWQAVIDTAQAGPGMKFLIHGASGGVGSFAAQFAKIKGAYVAATASKPSFDYLRSIGIDQLIDYERQRFEDEVDEVDVVIDPLGGDTQTRSFKVLKRGGMLINLIGEIDERAAARAGVRGVIFGVEYDTRELAHIAELAARGEIKPHITQVLPLDEAPQALDLNKRGESHGKIVLQVS